MRCTFWQECGLLNGAGCCHHPERKWGPWVVPDVCNKVCKLRVDGEPMEPAPAPLPRNQESGIRSQPATGPGTELKRILSSIGIHPEGCNCNSLALRMDREGPDWCETNLDFIVSRMGEEATKRGLPFLAIAARMLVLRAISLARKHESSET